MSASSKTPVRVAVTGAAGQIGYSLLFRLASGEMLGPDQPVIIHALELPNAMEALKGVVMELQDCAFPLVQDIVQTSEADEAFDDVSYALFVGSKPRGPGQERGDLLKENGCIFQTLGKSLNMKARKNCKSIVVGNPANTNCLILAHNCPDMPAKNFTSMMRLDHDRGLAVAAHKIGHYPQDITEFAVWGNHSPTMFPDMTNARLHGSSYRNTFGNMDFEDYEKKEFIPIVQQRGAAIIEARGLSSAASAANACIAQVRDWKFGNDGRWVSMGVKSNGEYNVPAGLWSGFPIEVSGDFQYQIVPNISLDVFQEEMIQKSVAELKEERNAVSDLLN